MKTKLLRPSEIAAFFKEEGRVGGIYAIQFPHGIKIGRSRNIPKRVADLLRHGKVYSQIQDADVLVSIPHINNSENEKVLHRLFSARCLGAEMFAVSMEEVIQAAESLVMESDYEAYAQASEERMKALPALMDKLFGQERSFRPEPTSDDEAREQAIESMKRILLTHTSEFSAECPVPVILMAFSEDEQRRIWGCARSIDDVQLGKIARLLARLRLGDSEGFSFTVNSLTDIALETMIACALGDDGACVNGPDGFFATRHGEKVALHWGFSGLSESTPGFTEMPNGQPAALELLPEPAAAADSEAGALKGSRAQSSLGMDNLEAAPPFGFRSTEAGL